VIGATVAEYIELAGLALDNKAEALELDLAGANTWLGQRPDSIVSDDPEAIARVIGAARRYLPRGYPISVKLSPYSDASLRAEVAAVLQEAPIQCVVMGNTHPGGAASVEARSTKAIALDQLRELWQLLPPEIPIIGVGGIETGADVRDFLDAGACAVQVDIAHLAAERRPSFFDELVADFEASV
jgi:dihydroorotate dehydrogenase